MSGANLRSGSWVLLDNLSAAVIAFGFFVVTARVLTPLEFGIAAIAISVSQMIAPMIDSLFHDAIIQRENLEADDVQTAFTAVLLWSVLIAVLLVVLTPSIASVAKAPQLVQYLPWMALSVLASGLSAVPAALARRSMDFQGLAIRTIIARLIATAVGLGLVFTGAGIWGVVVQSILSAVLAAILLTVLMRPSFRLFIDRARLRRMLNFAGPAMGTQLLLFASSRVFTLINSALLGPASAAVWNVALRFVEPLQMVAATTLGQFTLPIYSRRQANPAQMQEAFLTGSRRASLVLAPMFIGLGVCSSQIISLFVGPQWVAAAPMMAIICLVFAVVASRQLVEISLTSVGSPQLNLLIQAVGIVCSLGGLALGARYGVFGSTVGWSLRVLPFIFLAAVLLKGRIGVGFGAQVGAVAPAFLASGVMAGAVLGLQRLVSSHWGTIPTLVASVAVGVGVYAAAALVFDPNIKTDAKAIFARRGQAPLP